MSLQHGDRPTPPLIGLRLLRGQAPLSGAETGLLLRRGLNREDSRALTALVPEVNVLLRAHHPLTQLDVIRHAQSGLSDLSPGGLNLSDLNLDAPARGSYALIAALHAAQAHTTRALRDPRVIKGLRITGTRGAADVILPPGAALMSQLRAAGLTSHHLYEAARLLRHPPLKLLPALDEMARVWLTHEIPGFGGPLSRDLNLSADTHRRWLSLIRAASLKGHPAFSWALTTRVGAPETTHALITRWDHEAQRGGPSGALTAQALRALLELPGQTTPQDEAFGPEWSARADRAARAVRLPPARQQAHDLMVLATLLLRPGLSTHAAPVTMRARRTQLSRLLGRAVEADPGLTSLAAPVLRHLP